jgi:hypothetical protein
LGSGINSRRAQLENVQRQTGITPQELLDIPEIPQSMVSIWTHFINLHNTRTTGMSGANAITYSDILAYFTLLQEQPEIWEINTIRRLDTAVLQHFSDLMEKEQNKAKSKSK